MTADAPRFDLLVTDARASFRLANAAGAGLIRYLAGKQMARPFDEAVAQTWAEVICGPGPLSHEFTQGVPAGTEAFEQLIIRFGTAPTDPGFEGVDSPRAFFVEVRGAVSENLSAPLLVRLTSMLYLQPLVLSRPSIGTRSLPAVPEDERPVDPPPRLSTAPVGTRVEEF